MRNAPTTRLTLVVLCLAGLVVPSSGCKKKQESISPETQSVLDEVNERAEEGRQRMQQQLDEQGYVDPDFDSVTESSQALADAAQAATGDEKIMLKAISEINLQLRDWAMAYQTTVDAFTDAGGLAPTGLETEENVRLRLTLLDEMELASTKFESQIRRVESELRRKLTDAGLSSRKAGDVARGFADGAQLSQALRMRQSDARFIEASRDAFLIFENHIGLFEIADDGSVLFADSVADETIQAYNDAIERAITEGNLQAQIQQEMIDG